MKRQLVRLGIVSGVGIGVFYLALVWWCANEMASPARRAVNASHLAYSVSRPAGVVYGWRTGVRVSDIDSSKKARRIRILTLVVHGDDDEMVPSASGKALFDAIPGTTEKRWIEVPGAGHQNVLVTDFPIYATMARWFLEHAGFPRQCLANMGLRAVRRSPILLPRSSAGTPLDIGIGQDA